MDSDDGWLGGCLRMDGVRPCGGCADSELILRYGVLLPYAGKLGIVQHRTGVGGVPLQGGEDGVVHRRKDGPLAAEFHLGLGGVDVHVHGVQLGL